MTALYNEIEPFAAQWLRNLIAAGHIAPGDVDERSIEDVCPDDLRGYTQVHFFAGIGVWSAALRGVDWRDDRPVWSASCPCQGFSAAGKGLGFADERHLWPALYHLIDVCRPARIVGEQVASPLGLAWLDLVHADLEGAGYAVGAVDTCAAGFGAPHIRQRLYWVADASIGGSGTGLRDLRSADERRLLAADGGAVRGLADTHDAFRGADDAGRDQRDGQDAGRQEGSGDLEGRGGPERLGHHHHQGPQARQPPALVGERRRQEGRTALQPGGSPDGLELAESDGRQQWRPEPGWRGAVGGCGDDRPGPVNGFWSASDWLGCRDGRWRPVEPGTRPLAHGVAGRVGRLRAYGNAINKAQAEAFLACLP